MQHADKLELLAIDSLVPYARNARTHSAEQIAAVARSIQRFGFTNPVLIDAEGGIVAGHGRVLAAKSLGMDTVPCLRVGWLTEAEKRAYVLADNKLAEQAGWDDELLADELRALQADDFDLSLTGFAQDELDDLLIDKTEGQTDPDAVPPAPTIAITQPGDVWVLGRHRIMCGDSTRADQVQTLLAGGMPHLMVTDPPYGVEYDPNWRNEAERPDGTKYGASAVGKVSNDDRADWREAWALFPGECAYVWHADVFSHVVAESLQACGFDMRALIVWAKHRLVIGRGHYHHMHEPCWYAVKKGGTGHWAGDRKQTTLWQIEHNKSETGHGTQKPVECMRRPIENNSKPGDGVYEPFSGSGTTIIAAEQTGRRCYAMELSPQYVDVAVRRWQEFTGQRAVRESDGMAFPE